MSAALLPIPSGTWALTRRRSPPPGCEGEQAYAAPLPVTLHSLVSDGRYVMALVEHLDGPLETVREIDLQRVTPVSPREALARIRKTIDRALAADTPSAYTQALASIEATITEAGA